MQGELSQNIKKVLPTVTILLIFIGLFLRFMNIKQDHFIFYDEGYYLNYNLTIVDTINNHPLKNFYDFRQALYALLRFSLNTGKTLWFLIVDSRAFWGAMESWYLPRVISALAGSLTLFVMYIFARRFYNSTWIGLLSVGLLSVLPSHIFYSRLALQEALSTLFFLLGFYFYFFPKKFCYRTFISAFFFICVFFTNYRLIIIPVFVALVEVIWWITDKELPNFRKYFWHTLIFFFIILMVGCIDEGQNMRVIFSWMFHQVDLAKGKFDLFNLISYPYYIFKLESIFFGLLFFANIYYLNRHEWHKAFPFLLICCMIAIFSTVGERAARYLCVGLPFIVMSVSSVIVDFWNLKNHRQWRWGMTLLIFLTFVTLLQKSYVIANSRTDYKTAMDYVLRVDPHTKVLSTQSWVQNLYSAERNDVKEIPHAFSRLLDLYAQGYRYLIVGPQAYVSFTESNVKFEPPLEGYLGFITSRVKPVKIYSHFNDAILERFVFEHNENLMKSLDFLNSKDKQYGALRVYDIKKCIRIITVMLSPEQLKKLKRHKKTN